MAYTKTNWKNLPNTTTPITAENLNNIESGVDYVTKNVSTSEYSASSTYEIGDYCIYNNELYRCITAITTPEAFIASKWIKTTITNELKGKVIDTFNTTENKNINAPSLNAVEQYSKNNYGLAASKTKEVWINGKPLYTKTLQMNINSSGTYITQAINEANIEQAWIDVSHSYYIFGTGTAKTVLPVTYVSGDAYIRCFIGETTVRFYKTGWDNGTAFVTVFYTKTTD